MTQFIIEINNVEEKALLVDMISIKEWIDNAIHDKARKCVDTVVEQVSDKNAQKISIEEKYQIIRDAQIESAAERKTKWDAEFLAKARNIR